MQILKMDFQSQSAPPVVPVMQSDAQSRFIGIALYNGGTPYKAPDGAVYTVQYRGEGANNFGWYDQILTASGKHAAVTVDADNAHIITLELAEQALRRPGDVHVNLCVMGPDTGYELRTFDIFVTGVSLSSWLSYVSTCLEAQQAAEKAVTLAENSATTAKKAAASASADAKNAQDNASSAKEAADRITFIANGCKGYYSTAQDLRDAYPTAAAGSWAIVAENSTIWVWNPATSAWKDASVNVDFSDYYKKSEADAKFGTPATADQLGSVKVGAGLGVTKRSRHRHCPAGVRIRRCAHEHLSRCREHGTQNVQTLCGRGRSGPAGAKGVRRHKWSSPARLSKRQPHRQSGRGQHR